MICLECSLLIFARILSGNYFTIDSYDYYNITAYLRDLLLQNDVSEFTFVVDIDPADNNISVVRLFRPVVPVLALPLSFLITVELSYFIVNAILIFASTILIFRAAQDIEMNEFEAFASAVLFSLSYYVLSWGISILVEAGSWFFISLSVFLGQ